MDKLPYEIYSKRQKRLVQADMPVAYQYDEIPKPLRQQIIYIWDRALGQFTVRGAYNPVWKEIHGFLAEEHGRPYLGKDDESPFSRCRTELRQADTEMVLDLVEVSFRMIDRVVRGFDPYDVDSYKIEQKADSAIQFLNHRFKEHAVGYQYVNGMIVRVDSEYIHVAVVEPAISLLYHAGFKGPSDEFMKAHEHYRHQRNKEAIRDANNAFESTMKAICQARNWQYDPTWPAKKLIAKVLGEELIPTSLQNQLSQFASLMEALPTVRNKMGGHGQGTDVIDVPDYFAAHALHLAAANIVLLVEAHRALA